MSFALVQKRRQIFTYTATLNQVTFGGSDVLSNTLSFPTGATHKVYHNDRYVDTNNYTIINNNVIFNTAPNIDNGTHSIKIIIQTEEASMNDYAFKIKTSADDNETYLIQNDPNYNPTDPNTYYSKIRIEDDYLTARDWSHQNFTLGAAMDAITDAKSYTHAEVLSEVSRATSAESNLDTRLAILEAAANQGYELNTFTATQGQTTFTMNYDVGMIAVFINGILLDESDYTATSGTEVVLIEAADAGDIVSIPEYSTSGAVQQANQVTTYSGANALPTSGNTEGDFAFTTDTKSLYLWNGSAWDRVYNGPDEALSWTTQALASYTLATDGSATTVTTLATDPEGFDITYNYATSPSNQTQATIVNNNDGTFTLTPSTDSADNGTFTFRVTATDGVHVVSSSSAVELALTGSTAPAASADFSSTTLAYTLDNPNAYSTSADDNFGYSASVSNTHAIVGAPGEDDANGNSSGKAYIYNLSDGSLLYTLDNPNPLSTVQGDSFGKSVSISNTHAIVGAAYTYTDSPNSGKAYIYDLSNGSLLHTLVNPNPYGTSSSDLFGLSVAISDTYAIVGASWEDDAGGDYSGKAYIFNVTTGALLHTLDNPNAYNTSAGDYFGNSVDISDTYAIVGAYQEDDAGSSVNDSGVAYVFNVSDGSLLYTLDNPNPDGQANVDWFGWSVSVSNTHAIVSTYLENDAGGADSGKAYIYDLSNGSLLYTLANPNPYGTSSDDRFGYSVSISDTYAIVGAIYEDDASGNNSGKAYIFDLSDGSLAYTIDNSNAYGTVGADFFGWSVSISSTHAIVGVYREDDAGGSSSGKAYIFQGSA